MGKTYEKTQNYLFKIMCGFINWDKEFKILSVVRKLISSVIYEREKIGHTFSNEEMVYSVVCGSQWNPSGIEVNSGKNDVAIRESCF